MAGTRDWHDLSLTSAGARILDIKITHQCNNICRFCVAGDNRLIEKEPPAHKIKKCLSDNARRHNIVLFSGGEPTIRPDLPNLIQYAHKTCGYKTIIIQTNGRRLAYKAYLGELIDNGANQFSVSIHGHIPALHEYLTQAQNSFFETIAGIRNVLERGAALATNTVITKSNYLNLGDIAKLLGAIGVKQMQFAYPHLEGKALSNIKNIAPPMSIAAPHAQCALETAGKFGALAFTEGFPHCMLGRWKNHAIESIHTERKVIGIDGDIDDFQGHRMNRLKKKGPLCADCGRTGICEGPWADYPEHFSWKEFKPLP
jgi:MoaA/NifB/PqqE/SkfB family radical SAM enzyme